MTMSWRWWLVIVTLIGAMVLVACNGDDEEPSDNGPTGGATATVEPADDATVDEDEEEEDAGDVDTGGDAFDGVPVPAGARETGSGEWSGSIPGFVPGLGGDPADYASIEFKEYEVDESPSDIIDFYRSEMKGWDEGFVFSGGADGDEGGVGFWTRDDSREAIWITASSRNGGSDLLVLRGTID